MARSEGFEPPSFGIGIHCDIQLRHERMLTPLSFGSVSYYKPKLPIWQAPNFIFSLHTCKNCDTIRYILNTDEVVP